MLNAIQYILFSTITMFLYIFFKHAIIFLSLLYLNESSSFIEKKKKRKKECQHGCPFSLDYTLDIDGVYFGTTFPHLCMITYGHLITSSHRKHLRPMFKNIWLQDTEAMRLEFLQHIWQEFSFFINVQCLLIRQRTIFHLTWILPCVWGQFCVFSNDAGVGVDWWQWTGAFSYFLFSNHVFFFSLFIWLYRGI